MTNKEIFTRVFVVVFGIFVFLGFSYISSASVTISGTGILGDSSFNSISGVVNTNIDLGAGHTLLLQTTNNGPVTIGTGLVTLGGNLTISGLASSGTQCLQVSSTGAVSGTGAACGSGSGGTSSLIREYAAATCQSSSASLGLNAFTADSPVPDCTIGTNVVYGVAKFDNASTHSVQGSFQLPSSLSSVTLDIVWQTSVGDNTKSTVWSLQTACAAAGAANDPTWNTVQTVTSAANAVAYKLIMPQITPVTLTGCAGGQDFFWKFFRTPATGSDNLGGTAELKSLRFTVQ